MSKPEIRVFPNLEALSRQAAAHFEELAHLHVSEGRTLSVALSGGTTPKRLCQLLAGPAFADRVPWKHTQIFQVDERCVPPDHPDSNYRMIREALLSHVPAAEGSFHRMAAEKSDLEEVCRQYAEELARVLQPKAGEWPRLDLVFLGMGPDAHTASLFPGSPALEEKERWVRANYVEKLKANRLTMTLPILNAAAEVIFLVAGGDKAETLHQVLELTPQPDRFPAQQIRPANGKLSWYVDEAAARFLTPIPKLRKGS